MSALLIPAAYCEGHFPGQPIVPGVVQLEFMRRALAPGMPLREIRQARFRQTLRPEESLTFEAKDLAAGRYRAALRRGEVVIAEAEMNFGSLEDAAIPEGIDLAAQPLRIPSLDALMPHRPPMRFVEALLFCDAQAAVSRCRVPTECALTTEGCVPILAAVEAAAQTAAVWQALRPAEGKSVALAMGYLVSLRDMRFGAEALDADVPFAASIRVDAIALPLSTYLIEVTVAGRMLARGRIGTYLAG